MKNKLLIISIIASFALAGCGGGSDGDKNTGSATQNLDKLVYQTDNFSIMFPKDWETIEKDSFTSNVPAETVVGFRSNIKNDIFTANLNIGQRIVEKTVNSKDFAKSTVANAKKRLVDFRQISLEDYKLASGETVIETFIANYEGRKTASESIVQFRELFVADDGIAYTITAAHLPTEDESVVLKLDEMLKSFSLK